MTREDSAAIADYLAGIDPDKRALIERYYDRVAALVPEAVIGRSYAMAGYLYRGQGLISIMATKAGISIIPFSGAIAGLIPGLDTSGKGGSIYVTMTAPLPEAIIEEIVRLRRTEIDAAVRRR